MFLCIASISAAYAQKPISASEKLRPQWVRNTPVSKDASICYVPVVTYTSDPASAFISGLNELTKYLPRNWRVSTDEKLNKESSVGRSDNHIVDNRRTQTYSVRVNANGSPVDLMCQVTDTYWEKVIIGGNIRYKNHILYQVAEPYSLGEFQQTHTTTAYGARGLWRSMIIPGWGQFHKGSYVKGGLMLGGCAVAAAGIVFCENQRTDYTKKMRMTHDVNLIKSYNTKADHFATARNICIGAAAAIYLYNLIDAVAAPGARRVVINRNGKTYSMMPTVHNDGSLALAASVVF